MKTFNELPQTIQSLLRDIAETDPYGLQPETLYKNIAGSLQGTPNTQVSKIFEVPFFLVTMIEKQLEENDDC